MAKEKKELDRLNEREKLLHEKAEISKKFVFTPCQINLIINIITLITLEY